MEPDPDTLPTAQRIFALCSEGRTDQEVATTVGLPIDMIRGVLTSPPHLDRLRDCELANWQAVDPEVANRAAANRARRSTTRGIRLPRRAGRDSDRAEGMRGRRDGKGYRRAVYEHAIGKVLDGGALGAGSLTNVVGMVVAPASSTDEQGLARIERERDAAVARYRRDRDSAALDLAMAWLDAEERDAHRAREVEGGARRRGGPLPSRAVHDMAEGGRRPGSEDAGEALFSRIEVLGAREATIHLTDAAMAHGFAAAIPDRLDVRRARRGRRAVVGEHGDGDAARGSRGAG